MFENNLEIIKKTISSFTNNKVSLMTKYVQRKLDRSLDNYIKEIEINLNYLLYRDNSKVQKYLKQKLEKGEL